MAATSASERHGVYVVPQRFGISAILALTTLFAGVFAILKGFEASPALYLYFGTLGVSICLGQMFFGRVPRMTSIVAGTILLPFWVFVTANYFEPQTWLAIFVTDYTRSNPLIVAPIALACGAIVGYLAGTVFAGFFLLLDMVQTQTATVAAPQPSDDRPAAEVVEPPAPATK